MNKIAKALYNLIPARYIFAFLGCLGVVNMYGLRVNLSVAMVAMVNASAIKKENGSDECAIDEEVNGTSTSTDGEFAWDEYTQNIVLGSFFWGYLITQIPGGRVAEMFSGKWIVCAGVFFTAVFTLLSPLAARQGYWYLVAVRVAEGFFEGGTFPALHVMISRWSPPSERSRIVTAVFAGGLPGTALGMALSGVLATQSFAGGWPSIFYVFGISGLVWCVFWVIFVYDSPEKHPWISSEEKSYIEEQLKETKSKEKPPSPPWSKFARSMPVWAIAVAHFGQNWGFYTLLTELPTYLSVILKMDMKQNSLLSALPYLTCWFFSFFVGQLCDFLLKRKKVSVKVARCTFHSIGQIVPGIFLCAVTFSGCNRDLVLTFLILAITFNGAIYSGYQCNHIDIAPNYAGTLLGITNCIATIPGFLSPVIVGALTTGQSTRTQWAKVFYISAAVYLVSTIFFAIFSRGEVQSWNNISSPAPDIKLEKEIGKKTKNEEYLK